MVTLNLILRTLPWLLVIGLLIALFTIKGLEKNEEPQIQIQTSAIVTEIERIGKLELVKYNFKEITEINKKAPEYFYNLIKIGADSRMALISAGSAVGCIDLTKIKSEDLRIEKDTLYVYLPKAELCYYKVDLENTRVYFLETNAMIDEKAFIDEGYKAAERQIKTAALQSGILEQTDANAELFLRPLFEKLGGRQVVFIKKPDAIKIDTQNMF
jgi:hypothetical protein